MDAWDYRVVPATVYMYFAKYVHHLSHSLSKSKDLQCGHDADLNSILPALAFSLDM